MDIPERCSLHVLLQRFAQVMEKEELDQLHSLLDSMLRLQPIERSSPSELSRHTWLQC